MGGDQSQNSATSASYRPLAGLAVRLCCTMYAARIRKSRDRREIICFLHHNCRAGWSELSAESRSSDLLTSQLLSEVSSDYLGARRRQHVACHASHAKANSAGKLAWHCDLTSATLDFSDSTGRTHLPTSWNRLDHQPGSPGFTSSTPALDATQVNPLRVLDTRDSRPPPRLWLASSQSLEGFACSALETMGQLASTYPLGASGVQGHPLSQQAEACMVMDTIA